MRVVAGDLKGRRIEAPVGENTRPTTDKVREAVFNALQSLDVLQDARVLDLFAGTGAMGIEALSRGAAHCVFVENDRTALAALRKNLDHLGVADQCTVIASDAVTVASQQRGIDLVIADPPYGYTNWNQLLQGVSAGVVVLESGRPIDAIARWETIRVRKYGRTHVAFLRPEGGQGDTVEDE